MKVVLVCAALVAAVLAAPQQKSLEPIAIVRQAQDISPEGAYQYGYETANGIKADEVGTLHPADKPEDGNVVFAEGSYTYTGDDGIVYTITYIADNNGYRATGAHLPKK